MNGYEGTGRNPMIPRHQYGGLPWKRQIVNCDRVDERIYSRSSNPGNLHTIANL
jgi:hypothetical protein